MTLREAEGRVEVLQVYRLHQFVNEADKEQIRKMLDLCVDNLINLTEPKNGSGALHLAVAANNQDLVSFLFSQGAHPDIQDKRGRTPAMLAAEKGNHALVALLAQNKANMRLQDTEGKGVLFYCIKPTKDHVRCLELALKHKADVNNVSKKGTHVLQMMSERADQCLPMCLSLLEGGADPNASNQTTGITALMEAAKSGSVELVRAILKKGGDPNILDQTRLSAVHYAAMGDIFEVFPPLSAYLADMNVISQDGNTPLHYAAAIGNANCCKFLAQRGCNSKLKNRKDLLPRLIAKEAGNKQAMKELKKAEKLQGKSRKTGNLSTDPLDLTLHDWSHENESAILAAFGDEVLAVPTEKFISVLQKLKAPVELQQLYAIISAYTEGSIDVTDFIKGAKYISKQFLMATYAPKKKKGKGGKGGKKKKKKKGKQGIPLPICTLPLDLIQRRPDDDRPYYMIEKYDDGSDLRGFGHDHPPHHPLMDDSEWYIDKSAKKYVNINFCAKSGDLESLKMAFDQGVPVDIIDLFYKTPLIVACSSGNYEMVQYLISQGANVRANDQFYWTPLHHAAYVGRVDIVKLLLKAGAALDAQALNGGTPLMRAIQNTRASCVDFLIKRGADVTAQNNNNENCLDIAKVYENPQVIELVQNQMEIVNPTPPDTKKGKGKKVKSASQFSAPGRSRSQLSETARSPQPLIKEYSGSSGPNADRYVPTIRTKRVEK
ncbi:ankyrin repeat and EF-hand domain-containing protein 1-like [Genypterus blacodes]|uniref:ankyrin repeat and EF-hand domain-containing protein 1-like n=1 Tax=Genypterus blacodes TaxID=154954 RepID=UPI003F76AA16